VVASWLKQLGCHAYVLEGGVTAALRGTPASPPRLPGIATMSAAQLNDMLASSLVAVFDLGPSMTFRKAHIPGSHWSIRPRLLDAARRAARHIVLVADEPAVARLVAVDLLEAGIADVKLLEGGRSAWAAAGFPTAASPDSPPDAECIDYLFFVHDRHAGNKAAMRQYLAWETGLMAQLDREDLSAFRVGPA
jgi:rhodanese-related sulfurtransferase